MWASHPLRHGYSGDKQRFMGNEKRLLDEYTNICQTKIGVEYMIIYTTAARLLNALTEYYKSPSSSNLFDGLQMILENKEVAAKSKHLKKGCIASIEVLGLLRRCKNVDEVVRQMLVKYPNSL